MDCRGKGEVGRSVEQELGQEPLEEQFRNYCNKHNIIPSTQTKRDLYAIVTLRTPERLDTYRRLLDPSVAGVVGFIKNPENGSARAYATNSPDTFAEDFVSSLLDGYGYGNLAELEYRIAHEKLVVALHFPLDVAIEQEDRLRSLAVGIEVSDRATAPSFDLMNSVSGQSTETGATDIPNVLLAQLPLEEQLSRYCAIRNIENSSLVVDSLFVVVTPKMPLELDVYDRAQDPDVQGITVSLVLSDSRLTFGTTQLEDPVVSLASSLEEDGVFDSEPDLRDRLGSEAIVVGQTYPLAFALQEESSLRERAAGIEIRDEVVAAPSESLIRRATRSLRQRKPVPSRRARHKPIPSRLGRWGTVSESKREDLSHVSASSVVFQGPVTIQHASLGPSSTQGDEPRTDEGDLSRIFVAMWFDSTMDAAYSNGIRKAIEEAGFTAIRIDQQHYNWRIDDEILSQLRRSYAVVADFTHGDAGARGSVYFEAGYALALNKPVILMCREDQIEDLPFNTRQYNHIGWKDPADLYRLLRVRIINTLRRRDR